MKKKISFAEIKNIKIKPSGLSDQEVEDQRRLHGFNEIIEISKNMWLELLKDTLTDPMIWFLVVIGSVFLFIGERLEAAVLFGASVPLAFMDAILHWRTRASMTGLKSKLSSMARVVRNNEELAIDVKEIVPGDIILLSGGDFIAADGIFEESHDLQIDESLLTGEAFSVKKQSGDHYLNLFAERETISVDSTMLGYAGTRVLTGFGRLRVLYTGQQTLYGEIIRSVEKLPQENTPLQKSILKLVQILIYSAALFCVLLAIVRFYQGFGWLDALISAATLAVAAIPEEFPVVFTFFLGVGVYRLAKRQALVKRAVSVENIGRITHICTDKTGTITVGQLKLTHLDPNQNVDQKELLLNAVNASDRMGTDPVDIAVFEAAQVYAMEFSERLQVFPFTEERRYEAAFVKDGQAQYSCYIKGAPETILSKSVLSAEEQNLWRDKVSKWASKGHKVLACGRRKISLDEFSAKQEPLSNYQFSGLIVFEDPARPEVVKAVAYCRQNAIKILMITGDHHETALAIAKEINLGGKAPIMLSAEEEPEKLTSEYLSAHPNFLKQIDIVARCNPLQKLEIVKALKAAGELVAVTGDGINDVPALKAADIGIAMGIRGTRSAKEVSSIVLADDNFQTIVNAIIEGRQLFYNLKMSFEYLLLIHIPLVLTAAFIPLLGYPLLYLPVHIVWLELLIHPTALLAFQNNSDKKIKAPQHKKNQFFSKKEWLIIASTGFLLTIVLMYMYINDHNPIRHSDYARTKVMAVLALWSAGIVAVKTKLRNNGALIIFLTTVVTSFLLIQLNSLAEILHVSALHMKDWFQVVLVVIVFLVNLRRF